MEPNLDVTYKNQVAWRFASAGDLMKRWKLGLVVAAVATVAAATAIALIYPGIPAGMDLNVNGSTAVLHCHYLHWAGRRSKTVDISSEIKNSSITVSNGHCYRWSNWDPMKSS